MNDAQLEEVLTYRWPLLMRRVMAESTEEFSRNFVRSIARHSKKENWRPSVKQERIMRFMLTEWLTSPNEELEIIER